MVITPNVGDEHVPSTEDQIELGTALVTAVRSISHGDVNGPTGLELVSMSLDGGADGSNPNAVGPALNRIASAIENLADAVLLLGGNK
jgi:hypothetical protein